MSVSKPFNFIKPLIIGATILGGVYFGEKVEPLKKLNERSFYHNSSIEDGYYQDPRNLDIEVFRNEKNRLEVYLVNSLIGDTLAIQENMHVGTTGKTIDDFVDKKKSGIKNWFEKQFNDSTFLFYKK